MTLGEDYATIQTHSTWNMLGRRDELTDIDLVGCSDPIILEYRQGEGHFTLPPALVFSASFLDAHAVNIVVSPHLDYLLPREVVVLVDEIVDMLGKAGWRQVRDYMTLDAAMKTFSETGTDDKILSISVWGFHGDELLIKIERHEIAANVEIKAQKFYVVTLKITNDIIYDYAFAENNRKGNGKTGERRVSARVQPATV